MSKRIALTVVPAAIAILAACSGSAAPRASTDNRPIVSSTTSTTLPAQRLDGTGQAYLTHSGASGFKLFSGDMSSTLLGRGEFHEDGQFGAQVNSKSRWTATASFTAASGDVLRFTSVGGVQFFDKHQDPHSATTETITGGTGRFKGATGTMKTTGITTVKHINPQLDLQTYNFRFSGTITTES
jgi:hypothetical protein